MPEQVDLAVLGTVLTILKDANKRGQFKQDPWPTLEAGGVQRGTVSDEMVEYLSKLPKPQLDFLLEHNDRMVSLGQKADGSEIVGFAV
jgi:hypothetical protein